MREAGVRDLSQVWIWENAGRMGLAYSVSFAPDLQALRGSVEGTS